MKKKILAAIAFVIIPFILVVSMFLLKDDTGDKVWLPGPISSQAESTEKVSL